MRPRPSVSFDPRGVLLRAACALLLLACGAPESEPRSEPPAVSARPQALAPANNYALGRPVTQSSTAYGAAASRAVDGNSNGDFNAGSVTHTNYEESPYWEVDLGNSYEGSNSWDVYYIDTLELYNRTDCCSDRLRDIFVFASNFPIRSRLPSDAMNESGVTSYAIFGQANTPVHRLKLNRGARYIRVQLAGPGYLSLAEVRALGGTCPLSSGPLRYDQVQQRSIHNAYTFAEAEVDQLLYHRARNLEWDLRANPIELPLSSPRTDNNWYVWHRVDEPRRCRTLDDCLRLLNSFRRAAPQHEVITLHLELKTDGANWDPTFDPAANPESVSQRTPAGLDRRLRDHLGSALFTPADLLASCPGSVSLQDALQRCGWPTLDALRGRVIALTFGYSNTQFPNVQGYTGEAMNWIYAGEQATGQRRAAFLAPLGLTGDDGVLASRNWVVAHTEVSDQRAVAIRQHPAFSHMLFRSAQADDALTFNRRQQSCQNFITTDRISVDHAPWARTDNPTLYPFCPIGEVGGSCRQNPATAGLREVQRLYELRVDSGDIDGTSDSFAFASETRTSGATTTLTAFVGTASNSGVYGWAKGCLMARQSLAADAGYIAVCRAGDNKELFVQYRAPNCGCGTANHSASLAGAWDGEDAAWVKLQLTRQSDGRTTAQGYGSADGVNWQAIGPARDFYVDLPYQGMAASSNLRGFRLPDGSLTRFYFADLRRDGVAVPTSALTINGVGAPAQAQLIDDSGVSLSAPVLTKVIPALRAAPYGALVGLGADGRAYLAQRGADGTWPSSWQRLGDAAGLRDLTAIQNGDGRLQVFALDGNPGVWTTAQSSVGGAFGAWTPLWGADLTRVAAGRNSDGRLELLGLARSNGSLARSAQLSPGGAWGAWSTVGGAAGLIELGVGRNRDGRLQVFAIDPNPGIWTTSQGNANGTWTGAWTPTWGHHLRRVQVASDMDLVTGGTSDGRIHVFGPARADGSVSYIAQTAPGAALGAWTTLGTARGLLELAVGRYLDGRLYVAGLDGNPGVWAVQQGSLGGAFGSWWPTWGVSLGRLVVDGNSDGRLEQVGVDVAPGVLRRSAQTTTISGFAPWSPL